MCPSSTSSSDREATRPASDGLVPVSDDPATTPNERRPGLVIVAAFFVLTIGTAIVDFVLPVPRVELLGRERTEAARMRAAARIADGSLARFLEHELRLRSRVRDLVNPPYAFATLALLGQTKPEVIVGKNSRLFYRARLEPLPGMTEERVVRAAASFAAISRRFAAHDRRFLLALIPRKCIVAGDHLPSWAEPRPELDTVLLEAVRTRGVECPDLLPAVSIDGTDSGWERLGTHWLDAAQLRAAEALVSQAGLMAPEDERTTEVLLSGVRPEDRSDLLKLLGLDPTPAVLEFFGSPTWERSDVVFRGTRRRTRSGVVDEGGDAVIFGTSFTARMHFPDYLAHFMQKKIRNEAEPGAYSIDLMANSLAKGDLGSLPELVFLELPIAMIYGPDDGLGIAETLDALRPSATTSICELDAENAGLPIALGSGWTTVGTVPAGMLVRPDDGTIAIRIQRAPCDSDLIVCAGRRDSSSYPFVWPGEQTEITIPIVGVPYDRPVPLSIRRRDAGPSSITTLECVEIVHDLDSMMHPVRITAGNDADSPDDPQPIELPRHATLVIERTSPAATSSPTSGGAGLDLRLRFAKGAATDSTSTTVALRLDTIPDRLPAFVSLAEHAGRRLERISVSIRGADDDGFDSTWAAHVATPRY